MTDEPGKKWATVGDARARTTHWRSPPALCDDEGCPHFGTEHVCINRVERAAQREPCLYCANGKRTGLPGNACESCMNTGYANPTAEDLK